MHKLRKHKEIPMPFILDKICIPYRDTPDIVVKESKKFHIEAGKSRLEGTTFIHRSDVKV